MVQKPIGTSAGKVINSEVTMKVCNMRICIDSFLLSYFGMVMMHLSNTFFLSLTVNLNIFLKLSIPPILIRKLRHHIPFPFFSTNRLFFFFFNEEKYISIFFIVQ